MSVKSPVILLTRPQAQAEKTCAVLQGDGFTVLSAPMLRIETLPYDLPDLSAYDGLIFTSVNAVRAFSARGDVPENAVTMPLYCVGEKTADALCDAGCKTIADISGNIELLEKAMIGKAGRYLHLCGVDVVRAMDVQGVTVDKLPVYKAHKMPELSPEVAEKLTQQAVDVILFYSARTGQAFAEAVAAAGCTSALSATKALCLSDLVVHSIEHLPWQNVHVANTPDGAAMITTLKAITSDCTED